MSRTYRKPRLYVEHSDVSYVNRELSWHRPYRHKKIRRTDEEYAKLNEEAQKKYEADIKENGGNKYYTAYCAWRREYIVCEIRKSYVPRYKYVKVPYLKEECIKEALDYRKKLTRDGKLSQSGCRKTFKKMSKKAVRSEWKQMKQKIMKDEEDYEKYHPHDRIGKKFIWSIW